ncbi:MAG: hypothetical protein ACRBCJ_09440 [Hyphomicrobiaceae bacterium]
MKSLAAVIGRDVEGTIETHYLSPNAPGDGAGFTFRETSDGDGTVHRISAVPPEFNQGRQVHAITSHRIKHPFVFDDPSVQQQIHGVILRPLDEQVFEVTGDQEQLFIGGKRIVSSGLKVDSAVVAPGQKIAMELDLSGEKDTQFDIDTVTDVNLEVRLERAENMDDALAKTTLKYSATKSVPLSGKISLAGSITAPQGAGVYLIKVFNEANSELIDRGQLHVITAD